MFFYDIDSRGFFDSRVHAAIPKTAVEISAGKRAELIESISLGMIIQSSADGTLHAIAPPETSVEDNLERVKAELRKHRVDILDALAGIAGRSQRAGNTALAAEADALAVQLLDITDDAGLNKAPTLEAMRAAGLAAYRRIAAEASPAFAATFKEITGA